MAASFDYIERLGAGHFGEVWRVVDTALGAERALKIIAPTKVLNPSNFFHEAQMLKAVEHPNVVKVEEAGTFDDGRIYVAMEYLAKKSLEDEAKGAYIELTRAKRLVIDVLRGLEHAHNCGILHRDIKPANILIGAASEGKLSDFGLAVPAGLNLKALGVKEYGYVLHTAPEVFDGKPHSVASDIYACGVTLYRVINGDTHFVPPSPLELKDRVQAGQFPDRSLYRAFIPLSLRRVVDRAIAVDPSKRFLSAAAMRRSLEAITLEKNWKERVLTNGIEWICGWDNRCYEVQLTTSAPKTFDVTVRIGPSKNSLRRKTSLCRYGLSERNAQRFARRTLQDFVLGKLS